MRMRFVWLLLLPSSVLLFLIVSPGLSVTSSSLGQFNVTPNVVFLNWTNGYSSNIKIAINSSFNNITVDLLNATSILSGNYSQPNSQTDCLDYRLFVKNATTGNFTYTTSPPLNGTNNTNMTLVDNIAFNHLQCYAGRYWVEKFTVRNTTWTNESANITVFIDIPISSVNNPSLLTNGIATFSGSLPGNATTYHSYYFNTSEVANTTGVTINLTGWTASDVDIFLFDDSGNLKEKSINKNTTEFLSYNYLPSPSAMWEIRIYGNFTVPIEYRRYDGYLIFTRLNVTNTSNQNQQISSIDFGVTNTSTASQRNLTLKNEGNFTLSNVLESKELYYVRRFSGSGKQNFTFLVPGSSIATKVKVALNWTGASNYSFNLYNSNGTLLANSMNKYVYANKTNSTQEEYNETSDISDINYWKIEVKNNTLSTDTYTVTTFVYVNAANWLTSNFSSCWPTFNITGQNNSICTVQINLTVPNATLDGIYEGNLRYRDDRGGEIRIPIKINLTTPMLVVTNDAATPVLFSVLNSGTFRLDEDYGSNLTRTFNFKLNNTGFYDMIVSLTNSSTLSCTSAGCSGYTANLTYNLPSNSISKTGYQTLSANVTFNSSIPTGTYEGWIFINATNETLALSSHPYQGFNLSLKLNLTDKLYLNVSETVSASGSNVVQNITNGENVTLRLNVYYINQTSEITALNTSNFTTVWLQEKNVSGVTGRIPTTGSLSIFNGTNPIYGPISKYSINVTIPPNQPGGQYEVHVIATYRSDSKNFDGEGINSTTLIINNTGLYMNTSDSLSSVTAGSDVYYGVNVVNFGPLAATGATAGFYDNGCTYITPGIEKWGCTGGTVTGTTSSGGWANFTFDMYAYNISGCSLVFKIHGDANGTCSGMYVKGGSTWFNNITGLSITVSPAPTTTTLPALPPPGENVTVAPKYLDITSYPSLVLVTQNSSNSTIVTVKNINTTKAQDVKLIVENINSTWFTSTPALIIDMLPLNSTNFTVVFSVPANAEVKDYSTKFIAISNYANVSKTFTLRVLPRAETKAEINATLASFKQNMTELSRDINQSAQKGVNVTLANSTFLRLKALIDEAQSDINRGDYNSALYLFSNIRTLFNTTRTQLNQAIQEYESSKWFRLPSFKLPTGNVLYALIVAGVATGVILVYMFWPVKTEKEAPSIEPLYVPKEGKKKEDVIAMLKEKWNKLSKQKK